MGSVFPIPDLSMSTEAALFTAHDAHRTKYIAVPERAIRHLVGQPSPWRLCDGEGPSLKTMGARLAVLPFAGARPPQGRS